MATSQAFVENSHTIDHLERHELELDVLAAISALMANQTGQRRMLSQVLEQLERRLGMACTTVMLVSPDGTELIVAATRSGQNDGLRVTRYRRGEGIIGTVLQTGQPAVIPQIGREPRFQNRIHQRASGESYDAGFLCVPIILDSEVVGTLSADIPQRSAWPLEEHTRALGIVASLIAFDVKTRRLAELERHDLEVENERLRSALQERFRPDNDVIHGHSMPPTLQMPDQHESENIHSLTARVELLERDMIVDALKSTRGNVAAAARLLSITPRIIRYKIKNLGINSRRICEKRS